MSAGQVTRIAGGLRQSKRMEQLKGFILAGKHFLIEEFPT